MRLMGHSGVIIGLRRALPTPQARERVMEGLEASSQKAGQKPAGKPKSGFAYDGFYTVKSEMPVSY